MDGVIKKLSIVVGIIVSIIAINAYYVNKPHFETCLAGMSSRMDQMQYNYMINQAYSDVLYWTRQEYEVRELVNKYPYDNYLKQQLQNVIENKAKAEARLYELQQQGR